jgi:hypothetical protein
MKILKLLGVAGVIIFLFVAGLLGNVYAGVGWGTIKDNNNGSYGDILINSGTRQGNDDVGTWVDISTIPELRGEQGIQGEQGIAGFNGLDGQNGIDGLNGIDGTNGLDGYTSIKGVDYFDGQNGLDGINGTNGLDGKDGLDFDPAEVIRLDGRIDTEILDRISGDKLLQKNINKVENQSINRDNQLGNRITKETSQRKTADIKLNNKINTETTDRKKADKVLQGNINTETKQRKLADKQLQNNINTETQDRKTADKVEKKARILGDKKLQNNIDTETTGRINGDNFLNNRVNDTNMVVDSHSKTLQDHEQRISNLNGRVGKLERTQVNIRTEVKFIREKHLEVGVYSTYSTTRSVCSEVGVNIVFPIGESYLDRENKKINARLDNIDKQLGNSTVITKTLDSKGNTKSLQISQGQLSVGGGF